MEALLKRFSETCEKYQDACDEAGGYNREVMYWMIGDSFTDYSVSFTGDKIQVWISGDATRLLILENGFIYMHKDITTAEIMKSCEVLERYFDAVKAKWGKSYAEKKAGEIFRLEAEKVKIEARLTELRG